MTIWIGFLTDDVPEDEVDGAVHEVVLQGKGLVFRVVELPEGAPHPEGTPMRCVINRHLADEGV